MWPEFADYERRWHVAIGLYDEIYEALRDFEARVGHRPSEVVVSPRMPFDLTTGALFTLPTRVDSSLAANAYRFK